MEPEIDILKETIAILKKDQGVNMNRLCNKEKTVIVDALNKKYPIPMLLDKLQMAKSSYYYQRRRKSFQARHERDSMLITKVFNDSRQRDGYRRIKAVLDMEGHILSEKVIRRIMRENSLAAVCIKTKKFHSYLGEISPAAPNLIKRDFRASEPNREWLTDITEFSIPAGKVYLSPTIDCYDGMPVAWAVSDRPDAQLVNVMLDRAIESLPQDAHPIIHTDRGCRYRWPGWIERMDKAGLTRSMSRKGCPPDNAACEGFFGRLKNEMFYNRSWEGVTISEFIRHLEEYMVWYRDKRIKISLGGLSPMEYRRLMGVAA